MNKSSTEPVKRPRGRPRKNPVPVENNQQPQTIKKGKIVIQIPLKDEVSETEKKELFYTAQSVSEVVETSSEDFDPISELKKANARIKYLESKLSKTTSMSECIPVNTDIKLSHKITSLTNAERTNIACWHCTYQFDTIPCFIVDRIIDGTYHVFGCFCSYNCALAYNQDMSDYRVNTRRSLTIKLFNDIFQTTQIPHIAPPKEVLEKYTEGGISIEEYRNNFIVGREYTVEIPPLMHSYGQVTIRIKDNK